MNRCDSKNFCSPTLGFAKNAFREAKKNYPWLSRPQDFLQKRWPILDRLWQEKRIQYVDYLLVDYLLRPYLDVTEYGAFFVCYLILAARKGHLCVKGEAPSLNELWGDEGDVPLTEEEAQVLSQLLIQGSLELPSEALAVDDEPQEAKPFRRFKGCFYLQRYWLLESLLLDSLQQHLAQPVQLQVDEGKVRLRLEELKQQGTLSEEQAQGIWNGCFHPFSILSGGPGTGKTYTAASLIQLFWESLDEEARKKCQIVLAAPTGKAAAQLQKSLNRILPLLKDPPLLQAKTLHALLGLNSSSLREGERQNVRLQADVLVIDESSMMDIKMMALLFQALKKGCRLILIGDPHQLASVEAGSPFFDLIQLKKSPLVHLSTCLRAELSTIVTLAKYIHEGNTKPAMQLLKDPEILEVHHYPLKDGSQGEQLQLIRKAAAYFPSYCPHYPEPANILKLFDSLRLLSPLRKGLFGADELNLKMGEFLQREAPVQGWIAFPIMISVNDYQHDLFNGETGVLIRSLPLKEEHLHIEDDEAIFPPREEGAPPRRFPSLFLPKHELAYCLSIHKSQGSEFDHIILVLPKGSDSFGSEGLYTAVTRAKRSVEIYSSEELLHKMILRKAKRLSGILERGDLRR